MSVSVKERAKLLEGRAQARREGRTREGEGQFLVDTSDDPDAKENRPRLPQRQSATAPRSLRVSDDSSTQQIPQRPGVNLAIRPIPNWRPSMSPKAESTNDISRSSEFGDGLHRITLIDLEDGETNEGSPRTGKHDEDFNPTDTTLESKAPARDSPSLSLEQAKKRTALLSKSVLNDTRKFAETSLARSKTTAESFLDTTSPFRDKVAQGVEKAMLDTTNALDKSGASNAFSRAVEGAQNGLNETKTGALDMLDKTGASKTFANTRDDFADLACKLKGEQRLCSKCKSMPLGACFPGFSAIEEPLLIWATPLSRAIYHSDWCRMCQLLLSMLCRNEFDPLLHPEVAPYLQPELKGVSMRQWLDQGWDFTDQHWPFGRGEHRHEGATYILGPVGQVLARTTTLAAKTAQRIAIRSTVASAHGRKYVHRPGRNLTYQQGIRQGREDKTRHPLSCVLRVSIATQSSLDSPGVLHVNLVGYGNRPGGAPQNLSHFPLRAVHRITSFNPNEHARLSYGRLLDKDWIDLSLAKTWIEGCEMRHGKKCREHGWAVAMSKPGFLRVIDTTDNCIVESTDPANCRFVALSYVWGGAKTVKLRNSNVVSLMQKGGLMKYMTVFPRTITDAMEVVRAMGERYLWVDSLCILQENTKEALEQIATMDRVYGSALLTLVAAEGSDAHSGLRGVRRGHDGLDDRKRGMPRQISQSSAEFNSDIHVIAPFASAQDLSSSPWNARAWTYQEKLLSRRLMIFSGNEVVWHCRGMICREDMTVEDSGYPHLSLDWLALKPQYLGVDVDRFWIDGSLEVTRYGATRLVRSGTFNEYAKMIEQYTARTLSFSSDILNALAGLQQIFKLCFRSEFIYGLPEILLDVAILWRPAELLKRRSSSGDENLFPSWSWAGWVGQVAYNKPLTPRGDGSGQVTPTTNEQSGDEGIRPLLQWYSLKKNLCSLGPINGTGRGIPLDTRDTPREWEASAYVETTHIFTKSGQTPQLPDINPATRSHLRIHHLIFWTSCANCFQLGNAEIQQSDREWTRQTHPLRFSIVDSNFDSVGTILLDGDSPDWIDREKHEFILLAEAQYFGLDDEPVDVGEYPNYVIMLIERDEVTKIATRLGIGRIRKTAWMLADAELKLVCLG